MGRTEFELQEKANTGKTGTGACLIAIRLPQKL
jgi:hypothetical protein